mmetsp:Transcript_41523/g.79527  ORF Transcript_41523/g.79527 Transcript_41523/m.79527 type:complete len:522 (-) Transcript_41523:189-1754(-)
MQGTSRILIRNNALERPPTVERPVHRPALLRQSSSLRVPHGSPVSHSPHVGAFLPQKLSQQEKQEKQCRYRNPVAEEIVETPTEEETDCTDTEDENYIQELTIARLSFALDAREHEELELEKDSVYGAALLMPQLARSARWHKYLTIEAAWSLLLNWCNAAMQFWLLQALAKEDMIYAPFGGGMWLCNFGEGQLGPLGTEINSPERLYSFTDWEMRNFLRHSVEQILPEQTDAIRRVVDPGEYGVNSHTCRYFCVTIFVISTIKEFYLIINMARLLYFVPTMAECWLEKADAEKERCNGETALPESLHVCSETQQYLNLVHVKIAGIPLCWKLISIIVVLLPKIIIWKLTLQTGTTFLMNTAGSSDQILNAVALTFILSIDELICEILLSRSTKIMLAKCDSFPLHQVADHEQTDEELLDLLDKNSKGCKVWSMKDFVLMIPSRLAITAVITALLIADYYHEHCNWSEEDGWVSKPVFLPEDSSFSFWNTVLPDVFPPTQHHTPFWQMPIQRNYSESESFV